jgi:hypothetical protein
MKKVFLFLVVIASGKCFAATGSASDGELALLSIIMMLMLPLAAVYFTHFVKSRIKDFKAKRMLNKHIIQH